MDQSWHDALTDEEREIFSVCKAEAEELDTRRRNLTAEMNRIRSRAAERAKRARNCTIVTGNQVPSLCDPRNGLAIEWTPEMFIELERCIIEGATVQETMRRIGVEAATLARGAMLSLRLFLTQNINA